MSISPLKVLQIETTNYCNAHCKFCIHDCLKTFGIMSDELFLKILNEAKEIESFLIALRLIKQNGML
jgi:MoaA/NifB/PqqE/SkfB family radical SAM enzyme